MTIQKIAPRLPERLLANARVLSDRYAMLWHIPKNKVIVEVGVALGDFSENMLTYCDPEHFVAIDLFNLHTLPEFWGRSPQEIFGGKSHRAFYEARFSAHSAAGKVSILEGDSFDQIQKLGDRSVGVFYVDGDHTYEGVCRDLSVIREKIAPGGLIIMNDYIMRDHNGDYGVIQATNEFMLEFNWEMLYFCLEPNMYCDVVLRQIPGGA